MMDVLYYLEGAKTDKEIERRLRDLDVPLNKKQLLRHLVNRRTVSHMALAYLVNELVPADRTTKEIVKQLL